jgi:hypothetical protein
MIKKVQQIEVYNVEGSEEDMLQFVTRMYKEEKDGCDTMDHKVKDKVRKVKNDEGQVDEVPFFEVTVTKTFADNN